MTFLLPGVFFCSSDGQEEQQNKREEEHNRKNRLKPVNLKGVKHNGSTKRFYAEVGVEEVDDDEVC